MILSVSRRTDIPNYYADWFLHRIRDGFAYVRNPVNPGQLRRVELSPQAIDCIVFWTKNPQPMMPRLEELSEYHYYFQFTLTSYGRDIERNVPHKKEQMLPVFQRLSEKIGRKRVVWRYDPILFTTKYTPEYHLRAFEQIARTLHGYTEKCVISFLDMYLKIKKNMKEIGAYELTETELRDFAGVLSCIAADNGMQIAACSEKTDLSQCGISGNACIDKNLIEEITGHPVKARKDKNQRRECGCAESVDIGSYDTCRNGCIYCYANSSAERVRERIGRYDVNSPLLCSPALLCRDYTREP